MFKFNTLQKGTIHICFLMLCILQCFPQAENLFMAAEALEGAYMCQIKTVLTTSRHKVSLSKSH